MFKLFGRKGDKDKRPFLVNDHASYRFADLASMPETQLVMLVPRRTWQGLRDYIQANESVSLAGRLGANPGQYEWEWVDEPQAVRWWRRSMTGQESLFGMALAVLRGDLVELYGLIEVDDSSPHWPEVIPEEAANSMPDQARLAARSEGRPEEEVLAGLYRDYFRQKQMLTMDVAGQPALRRGTVREVERFRDALRSLIERAGRVQSPELS